MILTIKKRWFDMISSGIKKEEYRDIKPFYNSRFKNLIDKDFYVILRNGYSSESPSIKCLCYLTTGTGRAEWGAEEGKIYYVLHIKDVMPF